MVLIRYYEDGSTKRIELQGMPIKGGYYCHEAYPFSKDPTPSSHTTIDGKRIVSITEAPNHWTCKV